MILEVADKLYNTLLKQLVSTIMDNTTAEFKNSSSQSKIPWECIRELYPTISIGCFIKKPIAINYLVKRIKAELE